MTSRRVLPGFGLALGSTLLYFSLLVLLPLLALAIKAAGLSTGEVWSFLTDPRAVSAYRVTFGAAILATAANVLIGFWAAWILAR